MPGDLGLSVPMRPVACDGGYVVFYHSAISSGTYAQEIQTNLDAHPGSGYLLTLGSCRSLAQVSNQGTLIYTVYDGPFPSLSQACLTASRFPQAYVKVLDNVTAPDAAVQSCS